jgi:CRP-like cAMP-binding protein
VLKHLHLSAGLNEADCRLCAVRNSVLFAGLREGDFDLIHKPIEFVQLDPHDYLYHAGAKADSIYTIREGLIKLVQYLPDGTQRIVRLLRNSDVTGLESLLGQPYQHEAIALQPAQLCRIPIDVVHRIAQENPTVHRELLERWQRALNEADAWLTQLSTGTARSRVARLLRRLVEISEPDGQCRLVSREDMGAMLGITPETASRTIADFKRQGILREIGPNLMECDTRTLSQLADD